MITLGYVLLVLFLVLSEVTLHTLSFAIAFSIITFLHIVLGELAPKTLALERAENAALVISWPLQAFYKVFRWPIRLLDWSGTRVVRLFGLHPSNEHACRLRVFTLFLSWTSTAAWTA